MIDDNIKLIEHNDKYMNFIVYADGAVRLSLHHFVCPECKMSYVGNSHASNYSITHFNGIKGAHSIMFKMYGEYSMLKTYEEVAV